MFSIFKKKRSYEELAKNLSAGFEALILEDKCTLTTTVTMERSRSAPPPVTQLIEGIRRLVDMQKQLGGLSQEQADKITRYIEIYLATEKYRNEAQ